MASLVQIYDAQNIDSLTWPNTEDGQYAKRYLLPFIKDGPQHYIANANTKMMVLTVDDLILPLTVNESEYENSYVCSPYTQYIRCAMEALEGIKNRPLKITLKGLLNVLSKILRWGKINQAVFVNNWLLSTNLYPKIHENQLQAILTALKARFPHHAIALRSLNASSSHSWIHPLKKQRFSFISSRSVYFFNSHNPKTYQARMFKSDLKLLKETEYEVLNAKQISNEEFPRILSLYEALYLDKYSQLNPQLTLNFLKLALQNNLLNIKALKKDGRIDAVMGYFYRNGMMTSPFFGYDMALPKELGLYRLISTLLALEAKSHGMLLHASSGAASYKKLRRAEKSLEYTAVYFQHLPSSRRVPWIILRAILNTIGITFLKHYDF